MSTAPLGAFGKLPRVHDFVRLRIRDGAWGVFEDWLTAAVQWHEAHRSRIWTRACEESRPQGFVFRPSRSARTGEIVAGVMWPSHDVIGRRFPFVVFGTLPEAEVSREPHLLPGSLQSFFEGLVEQTPNLAIWESAEAISASLADQALPAPPNAHLSHLYGAWTNTDWSRHLGDLYGRSSLSDVEPVFSTIVEAVRPFIGAENPSTQLGLRLPLGSVPTASASFWIDLLRLLMGWHSTVPSFFMPLGSDAHAMLLQIGEPSFGVLTQARDADSDSDYTCDLEGPPPRSAYSLPMPGVTAILGASRIVDVLDRARFPMR